MLQGLRKKFKTLSKTKEQWEETKTYIEVKISTLALWTSYFPVVITSVLIPDVTHWFHLACNTNIPSVYVNKQTVPSIFQTQANANEKLIKEEFQKLHQFLQEEENTRLKALKQEEQIKIQVMCEKLKNISSQITTLSSTISEIEKVLRAKDLPFLQVQ